jgi:hypothetical protein
MDGCHQPPDDLDGLGPSRSPRGPRQVWHALMASSFLVDFDWADVTFQRHPSGSDANSAPASG